MHFLFFFKYFALRIHVLSAVIHVILGTGVGDLEVLHVLE